MKRIINKQTGVFLRDDFSFDEETEIGLDVNPAQGLYQPKWDFENEKWVEGLNEIELEAAQNQVPEKISNLQLRSQLITQGFDLGLIEQTFNQIADATQRGLVVTAWEYATNFYRNHSMIIAMGNLLGLTSAQVDKIFIKASKL